MSDLWVPPGTREKIAQEKCEHHWHYTDGEVKTSNPPWWRVRCCKCLVFDNMVTDEPWCGRSGIEGPHVQGRLYGYSLPARQVQFNGQTLTVQGLPEDAEITKVENGLIFYQTTWDESVKPVVSEGVDGRTHEKS